MRSALSLFLVLPLASCGARTDLGPTFAIDEDASAPDASVLPPGASHWGSIPAIGSASGTSYVTPQFFPEAGVPAACAFAGPPGECSIAVCSSVLAKDVSSNAGAIIATAVGATMRINYRGRAPIGHYPIAMFPLSVAFEPDDMIRFETLGGPDITAFKASVTMPVVGQLITPAFVPGEVIDTTQDLSVTWQPIPFGDAVLTISTSGFDIERDYGLTCVFDGQTGSAVVSQADLAALAALVPDGQATIGFLAMSRSLVVAEDWAIEAVAFMGSGGAVEQIGPVTLR
jgi:hypothetical protein